MRLAFIMLFIVALVCSCKKATYFSFEDEGLIDLIESIALNDEALVGFRKTDYDSLSMYIIDMPNEICDDYFGSEKVNKTMIHLYIGKSITPKDLHIYVNLIKKKECIVSTSDRKPMPDMMKMTEFIISNNEFINVSK